MSYNITLNVADDGSITIDETRSYTKTAPRGTFLIGGHVVPDGEAGVESLSVAAPDYALQASVQRRVVVRDAD